MAIQQLNAELADLLRAEFQARNESNFAWKSAVSALQAIPGLIACWPTSIARLDAQVDRLRDVGGGGYHLTTVGNPYFRYDNLASYFGPDGVAEYAFRTAGAASWASVIGTEAYIHPTERGLFFGGWLRFNDALGTAETPIAKWGAPGARSYRIRRQANGDAAFSVSNDGTATTTATVVGGFAANNAWYCTLARFDNTANELKLWVNEATATAVYNNVIFDSTADFTIGAITGPAEFFDGKASLCLLGALAASDAIAFSFYQQTRAMFGV
jgi:hypothetical protein